MSLIVRTGALTFYGDQPRREGFNIVNWSGWTGGVDVRQERIEIPQGDGDYDLPSTLAGRLVAMNGYCYTSSIDKLGWYEGALTGLLMQRGLRPFMVDELERQEWAPGKIAAKPMFEPWGGQKFADFSVQFWFPKPWKFGDPVTFPNERYSLAEVHHRGNADAAAVFKVVGAATGGYTINGPAGKKYTVTTPLVADKPHTITDGLLEVDGVTVQRGVTVAGRWGIPGGTMVPHSITPVGGTATLTVEVTPRSV